MARESNTQADKTARSRGSSAANDQEHNFGRGNAFALARYCGYASSRRQTIVNAKPIADHAKLQLFSRMAPADAGLQRTDPAGQFIPSVRVSNMTHKRNQYES
jgi:hypothetical protein